MRAVPCGLVLILGCSSDQVFVYSESSPAPILEVHSPVRASWQSEGSTTITGEVHHVNRFLVNGQRYEVDDGPFSIPIQLERGIHYLEVEAQGDDGHRLFDRRSVIAGEFKPAEGPIEGAVELRINQGGLNDIAEILSGLIDIQTINQDISAVNPLVELDYSWGTSLSMDFTNIFFNTPIIHISGRDDLLDVELVLPNLYMDTDSHVSVLWVESDQKIEMFAEYAMISGELTMDVHDGFAVIEASQLEVSLEGFSYDTSLIPGDLVESHLFEETIRESMEESLAAAMGAQIQEILSEIHNDLALGVDFELMGTHMALEAEIDDMGPDSGGVRFDLGLDISAEEHATQGRGYLHGGVDMPSPDHSADGVLNLSDDALNRVAYELWTGGVFSQIFTTEDESIDRNDLEEYGIRVLTISTHSSLPPVFVDADGGLEVQLGEMEVSVSTPGFTLGEMVVLRAAGNIGVELVADHEEVQLILSDLELHLDVVETDWMQDQEYMLGLIQELLTPEMLLGALEDFSITIPSIGGLDLDGAAIRRAQTHAHTTIEIDVSPN